MESILTKLNSRLAHTNRRILLLIDNAGCHPPHLETMFKNITICFLPANTTSKLQPLDLGIIKNFKVHYRTLLLKYIVAKIDECNSASEVAKSVNILVAIRWVAQAWEKVKVSTIQKCIRRAGILNDDMSDVVTCEVEDDPFQDLDEDTNLQEVIQQVMLPDACSVQEYGNGDDEIPVCIEMDGNSWDESFMLHLQEPANNSQQDDDEENDEEDDEEGGKDSDQPEPAIKTFKEAIASLEEVQHFLERKGQLAVSFEVGSILDSVAAMQSNSLTQRSLFDYFSPK